MQSVTSAKILGFIGLSLLPLAATAEVEVYEIDSVHSGISFEISHNFVSKVPGSFSEFSGEIHLNKDDIEKSVAKAKIKAASVDTNNDKRDGHLQNEDFFNTGEYELITFTSTEWDEDDDGEYEITGDLTMLGQTHSVTIDAKWVGEGKARDGSKVIGISGTTTLDRTKWGMGYGTPLVGTEVEVKISLQARKVAEKSEG